MLIIAHHLCLSCATQFHSSTFRPILPLSVAQGYEDYSNSEANADSVRGRDVSPLSNPKSGGLSLVGCPLLLFMWSLKTQHEALTRTQFTRRITTGISCGVCTLRT